MSAVLGGSTAEPKPMRREMHAAPPAPLLAAVPAQAPAARSPASAAARLALSRSRLRQAMMDIAHPPARAAAPGTGRSDVLQQLFSKLRGLPGAAILIDTVESWWREHPLHTAGVVAGEASRAFVRPIVQKNPQSFLLGAATIGALLMLTRPWRWLLRPALFVGLVPQLLSHAMKRMPLDSWLRMAARSLSKPPKRNGTSRTSAPPQQPL